jgi:hypothetical protein
MGIKVPTKIEENGTVPTNAVYPLIMPVSASSGDMIVVVASAFQEGGWDGTNIISVDEAGWSDLKAGTAGFPGVATWGIVAGAWYYRVEGTAPVSATLRSTDPATHWSACAVLISNAGTLTAGAAEFASSDASNPSIATHPALGVPEDGSVVLHLVAAPYYLTNFFTPAYIAASGSVRVVSVAAASGKAPSAAVYIHGANSGTVPSRTSSLEVPDPLLDSNTFLVGVCSVGPGNRPSSGSTPLISTDQVSYTSALTASADPPTVVSGYRTNDLMVFHVAATWLTGYASSSDISGPVGTTLVAQSSASFSAGAGIRHAVYRRILTGSATPSPHTFTWSGAANEAEVRTSVFRNVDPTTPIIDGGMQTSVDANPIAVTAPSVGATADGQTLVCSFAAAGFTWTPPAQSFPISQIDQPNIGLSFSPLIPDLLMCVTKERVPSGSTGTREATCSPDDTTPGFMVGLGHSMVLVPAG